MKRTPGILLLFPLLLAVGCHRTKTEGTTSSPTTATLRYRLDIEPNTLDPALSESASLYEMLQNIYEGLTMLDEKTRVIPCLAERWEISPDKRTYTFHLRKSITFQAPYKRPVTAEDIKWNFERILWPETKSPILALGLTGIEGAEEIRAHKRRDLPGIKVLDPQTVSITLTKPSGYFLVEIGGPMIVCREAFEKTGGKLQKESAIGTGPFLLKEYQVGRKVVLDANPDYWGGRPKLDRIERPIVLDSQTAHILYERDELDVLTPSGVDFVNDQADSALKVQSINKPLGGINFLGLNQGREKVFRDIQVRQAFAMAIDRDALAKTAFLGISPRSDGLLAPGILGSEPPIHGHPYDPATARNLLAKAGFPNGQGFPTLTLAYIQKNPAAAAAVQIIRDNLKQNLGITVNLQEREATTFFSDGGKGKLGFFFSGWVYVEPRDLLSVSLRTGASYNMYGYSNPTFDALVDQGDTETDQEKRAALYRKADQIITNDVPVIALASGRQLGLVKPWVHDLDYNLGGFMPHYRTRIQRK